MWSYTVLMLTVKLNCWSKVKKKNIILLMSIWKFFLHLDDGMATAQTIFVFESIPKSWNYCIFMWWTSY